MSYLSRAVTVAADADHNGWFDHMGGLAGWWVIFPLAMMIFMFVMMSRMFSSRRRGSGGGSGMGPMCMGDMGGHSDENHTADDGALNLLRRRYASGELSDEEFDAKRRMLEGA